MNFQHDLSIYYLPAKDLRHLTRNSDRSERKNWSSASRNYKFIISVNLINSILINFSFQKERKIAARFNPSLLTWSSLSYKFAKYINIYYLYTLLYIVFSANCSQLKRICLHLSKRYIYIKHYISLYSNINKRRMSFSGLDVY